MDKSTDPKHAHKKAVDAFGGDPLNPNMALQQRIAAVVSGGKADDQVTRWAAAFATVCPNPVQLAPVTPPDVYMKALPEVREHLASPFLHRETLAMVAEAVNSDTLNDTAKAWAVSIKAL